MDRNKKTGRKDCSQCIMNKRIGMGSVNIGVEYV